MLLQPSNDSTALVGCKQEQGAPWPLYPVVYPARGYV